MDLDQKQKIYFRDQFREARAVALRDAEGYQQLLFVLERFGYMLKKDPEAKGLGTYKEVIAGLAQTSPLAEEVPGRWRNWHTPFNRLYQLVNRARNDALHQGAFARHLTAHAIQLAIILEDALMEDVTTVEGYMVRDPICAFPWQPVSFVRQQMLTNSFSYLPISIAHHGQSSWHLIADNDVATYLQEVGSNERKRRLMKTVEQAVQAGELSIAVAKTCHVEDTIDNVLATFKGHPLLVVDEKNTDQLLGILTAFDLL